MKRRIRKSHWAEKEVSCTLTACSTEPFSCLSNYVQVFKCWHNHTRRQTVAELMLSHNVSEA